MPTDFSDLTQPNYLEYFLDPETLQVNFIPHLPTGQLGMKSKQNPCFAPGVTG